LKFKVIHNTMKKLKTIWIPCLNTMWQNSKQIESNAYS
jgi:hypothetical protein